MRAAMMIRTALLAWTMMMVHVSAQTPPPPPPPEEGGAGGDGGSSIDLSKIPIPEADRQIEEEVLTPEERRLTPIQVAVVPVGFIPPPIIEIGKDGMPREKYRHPLAYPPAVYHVKTGKGTVRVLGSQNQVGPFTRVPMMSTLSLSYERPPDPEGDEDADEGEVDLVKIDDFSIPGSATHLVVVLWKEPSAKRWTSPRSTLIDVSPGRLKANSVVMVNASGGELAMHRGDVLFKVKPDHKGPLELGMNAKGEMPLILAAPAGNGWSQLVNQVIAPRKDEKAFIVAWRVPPSPAQPTGVAFSCVRKRLTKAEPFEEKQRP
jgi:hypothetical protein